MWYRWELGLNHLLLSWIRHRLHLYLSGLLQKFHGVRNVFVPWIIESCAYLNIYCLREIGSLARFCDFYPKKMLFEFDDKNFDAKLNRIKIVRAKIEFDLSNYLGSLHACDARVPLCGHASWCVASAILCVTTHNFLCTWTTCDIASVWITISMSYLSRVVRDLFIPRSGKSGVC